MIGRTVACILLLISVIALPFWISVILALAAMFYFNFFIEAIFIFLISDLIHGVSEPKLFNLVFASFFVSVLIFVGMEVLKKKLRF